MVLSRFRLAFAPANSYLLHSRFLQRRGPGAKLLASVIALACAASGYCQSQTATTTSLAVTSGGTQVSSVPSGTVVALTATVTAGSTPVTPGRVEFCDATARSCMDVHLLGSAQLTSKGTATLKIRPGIGSHSYKAVFMGTDRFAANASDASELAVTGTIPPLKSATTINQQGSWGTYALSATVTETGNIAPPSGTVSFLDTNHGNAVLGTGSLGAAMRGVAWTGVNTNAPGVAGVTFAAADLNGDGIPDLFVEDYFGTYDVLLGNGDGTFTVVGSPFGPSSQTGSFVLGDFNNDGIADVAAINAAYDAPNTSITIFLGNGDGTFTVASSSPAIGLNPTAIATADINGDGNADLMVSQQTSSGSGEILFFLGNGDGTFTQSSTAISTDYVAASIIPADLNGDGKIDFVVPNASTKGTGVYLGKGDGTFTEVGDSGVPESSGIAIADLNNDGLPDLIVPGPNDGNLTAFLGNGDGTFTQAPASPDGILPQGSSIVISDLNQDGIPDVAYDNGTIAGVLFGKGDGTFVPAPGTITLPYAPAGFLVADFNGDGWPDILTQGNDRTVADFLTAPTETATASAAVSLAAPGTHLAEASYPGDSHYNASSSGTIALWGPPAATTTSLTITSGGKAVSSVAPGTAITLTVTVKAGTTPVTAGQVNFCDATAPHCTDIHLIGTAAVTSNGTAAFKFVPAPGKYSYKAEFLQNGLGATSSSGAESLTVGPAPAPVYSDSTAISSNGSPGDYSLTATVVGYGGTAAPTGTISFLDTSFGNASLGSASLGSATPGIGFLTSQISASGSNTSILSEITGDFNNDGIPDVAFLLGGYGNASGIAIFLGKGDGTFTAGATITSTAFAATQGDFIVAGDFNADGKLDLAVIGEKFDYSADLVTTFLGNGDGTFAAGQTSTSNPIDNQGGDVAPGGAAIADFNGDGKLDLALVGDNTTGGVRILLGNGDGTFTPTSAAIVPAMSFNAIATGDFNGDGIPDLVAAEFLGPDAVVFLGKGDGTFTAMSSQLPESFARAILEGDFNGDGKADLVIGENGAAAVYLGNGDGTFTQGQSVSMAGYSLIAGDFNGDGITDLAGIDLYGNQINLAVGNGDGTFTATTPQMSGGPAQVEFIGIAAADFNGDGRTDLSALQISSANAYVFLTQPTETATATVNNIVPIGAGTHNVEASYPGDGNYPSSVSGTVALTAGLAPLVVTPASGSYTTAQTVTITESVPGATIYYSASGTVNTNGFVAYTGPIVLNEGGTESIQAYATETGYQQTNYVFLDYTIELPAAPQPVFTPAPGSYSGSQSVTISDALNGATIYYTTDGTLPTFASAIYSGAITVSGSQTLVASAVSPGYSMSHAATGTYIIESAATSFLYTFAGNGAYGYAGDDGPATQAWLNNPGPAVIDNAGNVYFSDQINQVVRKVSAGTGTITTVAGTGTPGYSGDGGPATSAQLHYPASLAIDSSGNLYINDVDNAVIRVVAAKTGLITTYAGNGKQGVSGDGGPATSAGIGFVGGLAVDAKGNLYLAEEAANTVREVTAATGTINTIAGTGSFGYSGDGGPALQATFNQPDGLAFDTDGNLYIADGNNNVIREVNKASGNISTVAGNGFGAGKYSGGGFSGDGGSATSAELNSPQGVALDGANNLYIVDQTNQRVRKVSRSTGIITTVAGDGSECNSLSGDGGPATSAALCRPWGVASDKSGNLFVTDAFDEIHEVTAPATPPTATAATPVFSVAPGNYSGSQVVTVSDSTPGAQIYITMDGTAATTLGQGFNGPINVNGNVTIGAIAAAPGFLPSAATSASYTITTPPTLLIDTVAGNGQIGFSGQGGSALQAQIGFPNSVALDHSGNLFISDGQNNVVWMVSAETGVISIYAGDGSLGFSGDNGLATSAMLSDPEGLAVDSAGDLYIADTYNSRIREVSAGTGIITTVAGNGLIGSPGNLGDGGPATSAFLAYPDGVALDASGNLYIADTGDNVVRKVTASTGIISTVAGTGFDGSAGDGGPATSASIAEPVALAFDPGGNLYIATPQSGQVRKVAASTGMVSTVAGNGSPGGTGDGSPAIKAEVDPEGIAVDAAGNLYLANSPNTIRKVDAQTGVISRYAGNGYSGSSGDGGSATVASLCNPDGIAFDDSGSLYIADQCNYRVREVTSPKPAATPVISLASGTYKGAQSVTISDATSNAVIFYTTDGSTPSTGSNEYSGAVTVSATETLKAIAVAPGFAESAMATAAYVIMPGPAMPTIIWATPAPINYGTPLSSTQLDATASVPGTFSYSPPAGTVLSVGQHTLGVTFTPNDTTDYTTATASVTLVVNASNPVPVVASLSPAYVAAGGSAFTLSVGGSGFQSSSTVNWGTTALSTQFVSATQLTAQVTASEIANAGTASLAVQTPAPGGGTSNAVLFEIDSAPAGSTPPSFTTKSITVTAGNSASYPVTLPSSATNVSVNCLNLPTGAACSYSSGSGAVTITTSSATPKGTYQITVVFTETLPGAAAAGILLPFLLLPVLYFRKRFARGKWLVAGIVLAVATVAIYGTGCGGGSSTPPPPPQTHQVTSSGSVTLIIQ